jgi:hypothetical protein
MTASIVHREPSLEEIRTRLCGSPLAAVRGLLPDRMIVEACREHGYDRGERKYGPVATALLVRPGRLEPRAIARERKHYPSLRESRAARRRKRLTKAG